MKSNRFQTRSVKTLSSKIVSFFLLSISFVPAVAYGEGVTSAVKISSLPESKDTPIFCLDQSSIQIDKITNYQTEKDSILEQFQSSNSETEPKRLLQIAADLDNEFIHTGCRSYLLEGALFYKTYYELWRKSPTMKHPISDSIQREYRKWSEKIQSLRGNELSKISPDAKLQESLKNFEEFKYELSQEKYRMDELIRKRDQKLIPSIVVMSTGIVLTIAGGILQSFNKKLTGSSDPCITNGIIGPCAYNTSPISEITIGVGVALTVGGAIGIGVSMHQTNKASSPVTPASSK